MNIYVYIYTLKMFVLFLKAGKHIFSNMFIYKENDTESHTIIQNNNYDTNHT